MRFLLGPPCIYIYTFHCCTKQNTLIHTQSKGNNNKKKKTIRVRFGYVMPCAIAYFYTEIHESRAPKRKANTQNRSEWITLSLSKRRAFKCTTQIQISTVGKFFFLYQPAHTRNVLPFLCIISFVLIKCDSTFSLYLYFRCQFPMDYEHIFFFILASLVEKRDSNFTIVKSITFTQTLYYPTVCRFGQFCSRRRDLK